MNTDQFKKMQSGAGFIAALDQSGGSTPKALKLYGIDEDAYSNDAEMFDLIHEMRTRIITSPAFDGDRILGAILFEDTMDRTIEGRPTADYLWKVKRVVPFLKVDKGLADEEDGAQVMKPMPGLDDLLARAATTACSAPRCDRSSSCPARASRAVVDAAVRDRPADPRAGLVPIIEPEVDIHSPAKAEAEDPAEGRASTARIDALGRRTAVMLKLTLPETDNFYPELSTTPRWSAWWRCPAATAATRPTRDWPATTAWSRASPAR